MAATKNTRSLATEERFWAAVEKCGPDDCWPWLGARTTNGYGRMKIHGKNIRAHRFSYEIHKGQIPADLMTRHSCDNKICVNPNHLLTGTALDNAFDMVSRERHRRGSERALSKLTEADIHVIRHSIEKGLTQEFIAKAYGVTVSVIGRIINGRIWTHVPINGARL